MPYLGPLTGESMATILNAKTKFKPLQIKISPHVCKWNKNKFKTKFMLGIGLMLFIFISLLIIEKMTDENKGIRTLLLKLDLLNINSNKNFTNKNFEKFNIMDTWQTTDSMRGKAHSIKNIKIFSVNKHSVNRQTTDAMVRKAPPTEMVVAYLAQPDRLSHLRASLYYLFKNFLNRYHYKVIIFHSGDITWESLNKSVSAILNEEQRKLLELHEIKDYMVFPPAMPKNFEPVRNVPYGNRYPGYHQMMAFWFLKIFLHPRMQNVSYYWRLDTDSFLFSDITYDIFEFLLKNKITYAFRFQSWENCCAHNLIYFLQTYILQNNLSVGVEKDSQWLLHISPDAARAYPQGVPPGKLIQYYYNNFEFVHMPSFRDDPLVWNFSNIVWHDPILNEFGLYKYRWGDHILRFYTVNIFPQLWNHIHHFCDIHYFHTFRQIASCSHTDTPKRNSPLIVQHSIRDFENHCNDLTRKFKFDCRLDP